MPQQTRQDQAGTVLGAQPQIHEGHPQLRIATDVDQIAMQQQGGTDAHRRAGHCGDHRLAELEQGAHELEHFAVQSVGRRLDEVGDIVAAGEARLAPGQQHHAHAGVALGLVQHFGHSGVHGTGQRILLVRAVHAQGQQTAVAFDMQVFAHARLQWVRRTHRHRAWPATHSLRASEKDVGEHLAARQAGHVEAPRKAVDHRRTAAE